MARWTGGILWRLLAGVFLLVLFSCLSVILKCICFVYLDCVFGLWLTLYKSDNYKFCLSLSFFSFDEQGGTPGGRKLVTEGQKGETGSFLTHLNNYLN